MRELSGQTGLTENVIRKHVRLLRTFLGPYIKRGHSNILLFDPNCVVIFGEIKKLKAEGKSAREITSLITEVYSSAKKISYEEIPADQTVQTGEQIKQILELYQMLLAEKDRMIQEMDKRDLRIVRLEIERVKLQESLKLLPGGKKPAILRKEWEQAELKARTAAETLKEFKRSSCLHFFKRKKLLTRLGELL